MAALLLELLLRALPTPTATRIGQYVDPHVTTYPPGLVFRTATGWSMLNAHEHRANESGFIPDRPFEAVPGAIAVIGDSLVEQSMLPPHQRLSVLLEQSIGIPVYAMGFPGSSLFDYLERMRYAHDALGVRRFWVVVERADVKQSLCAASAYTDACMKADGTIVRPIRSSRGSLNELLSKSALLQYFVGVLRLSPTAMLATFRKDARPKVEAAAIANESEGRTNAALAVDGSINRPVVPSRDLLLAALPESEALVVERFIDALSSFREAGNEVRLVVDPRIARIDRADDFIDPALAAITLRAHAAGFIAVHPVAALAAHRRASGLELRVGPYDGHWNVRANHVIAAAMRQAMDEAVSGE